MSKEYLTYRFGFVAVKKGFATPDQVSRALDVQLEENLTTEKHRLIGDILVGHGAMNESQVQEVLKEMEKT